jgi:hypothetical protein
MSHPVIGELHRWEGAMFTTKFGTFDTGRIHGLAWVSPDGKAVEIMAIVSRKQGKGHFRDFIRELKERYQVIRFLALLNRELVGKLLEYDFVQGMDVDEYGDKAEVMDWRKK